MIVKDNLYRVILVVSIIFLALFSTEAQEEAVVVRPKTGKKPPRVSLFKKPENRPLTPEEKYALAWARHLALQDEKTRMRILNDIKMTNAYYDKQKDYKFVKWIKRQKFKLKRKGIL
ncbi:MAG TPA: hypothetical protein PLD12_02440 [Bacteroidales bacterium]|nr:hypothetical protein [Bacteroidales bacterium]HOK97972.1 hypothetical protein [Bacteroidales bacterium]HPO65283.1 hypothetical protein [Bacteroidales bacterium]